MSADHRASFAHLVGMGRILFDRPVGRKPTPRKEMDEMVERKEYMLA